MKNFVKALDRNSSTFSFLYEKFPKLSTETINAAVFIVPQIMQLFRDLQFDVAVSDDERQLGMPFDTLRLVF